MVQEANIKRAQAEKSFAESEMKVGNLTIESNIDVCFDLDVRTDDFVALLHHQFYSTKIHNCELRAS